MLIATQRLPNATTVSMNPRAWDYPLRSLQYLGKILEPNRPDHLCTRVICLDSVIKEMLLAIAQLKTIRSRARSFCTINH